MRIITKLTLLYLGLLFLTLTVGGFVTYQKVKDEVKKETDYSLREETRITIQSIKEKKPIDALQNTKLQIKLLPEGSKEDIRGTFSDTIMMHRRLNRLEVFRSHQSSHNIDNQVYRIIVTDVFIEENDMLEGVINTMTRLFIALGILFILFGVMLSRVILRPFHETLHVVDNFKLSNSKAPIFPKSTTKEFSQLNVFLKKMMTKASKDYQSLKEFSENASHEMQTPLAIIKGKLELLQESERLEPDDHNLIMNSQKELSKLSQLTYSLGLLTKLDNEEFRTEELTDFTAIVEEAIEIYKEIALLKKLEFHAQIAPSVHLNIDKSLANILVSNLLKNAIQHNLPNGKLEAFLTDKSLIIRNNGPEPKFDPKQYFNRFAKHNQSSNSLGLGLSIVRKICNINGFDVSYEYNDTWHRLAVEF